MEQLRLTVGLAHAVPGAEVLVQAVSGSEHLAANSAEADLHLCSLRHAIVASLGPNRPDITQWIRSVEIQGSLRQDGAGTYASTTSANGEWWFATVLRKDPVLQVLQQVDDQVDVDDDIQVIVKPDPCLGVTVVGLAAPRPELAPSAESAALEGYTSCVVEELLRTARLGTSPS